MAKEGSHMLDDIWVIAVILSPVAEARLGVPLGLAFGIHPALLIVYAFVCACVIYFVGRLALETVRDRMLSRVPLLERVIRKTESNGHRMVGRYGWFGLFLFVAVPAIGTGAYSGTLVSWFLGLHRMKAAIVVISGATVSALVVLLICSGVLALL